MTTFTENSTLGTSDVNATQNPVAKLRPHADVLEHNDHFVMLIDLPGVAKQDLEVTLEKSVLNVSGKTAFDVPEGFEVASGTWVHRQYERAFRLSDQIDQGGIDVELKDGVLKIVLPKSQQAQKTKLAVR